MTTLTEVFDKIGRLNKETPNEHQTMIKVNESSILNDSRVHLDLDSLRNFEHKTYEESINIKKAIVAPQDETDH